MISLMNLVLNSLTRSAKWGAEGTFLEVCKGFSRHANRMWNQVRLAVDLARHASACCGELPEVCMELFIQTQTTAHVVGTMSTRFIDLAMSTRSWNVGQPSKYRKISLL